MAAQADVKTPGADAQGETSKQAKKKKNPYCKNVTCRKLA
jgi:hypothetical protein